MRLKISEVKCYLIGRRSKQKSGVRENELAYLEASKVVLEEDDAFLKKFCTGKGYRMNTNNPTLKLYIEELKTKRKSLKKRVVKHMKVNG